MTDYSGYDEQGQPEYRNTADGPQCSCSRECWKCGHVSANPAELKVSPYAPAASPWECADIGACRARREGK